jgi:hypothetical protein
MSIACGLAKACSIWLLVIALKMTRLATVGAQLLGQVPRDCLALSVEVGREPDIRRLPGRLLEGVERLALGR